MPSNRKSRRTTSVSMTSSANRPVEFNPDYTYVKRDLTRIGILAGSFFGLLIILSFFIQ